MIQTTTKTLFYCFLVQFLLILRIEANYPELNDPPSKIPKAAKHCRVFYSVYYEGLEADCSNLGLMQPPTADQVPENLVALDLSNNLIEKISDNQLRDFSSLKSLDLSDNLLQKLPPSLIRNLDKLVYLNLGGNMLQSWPITQVNSLQKLERLDLSRNEIFEISENHFASLTQLRLLNLSFLPLLDAIHPWAFSRISSRLEKLDIRESGLKRLDFIGALPGSAESLEIYLGDNSLVCDCLFKSSLKIIKNKQKNIVDFTELRCSSPGSMSSRLISTLTSDQLKCRPGAGQVMLIELNDKQVRAKCAFREADTVHWYLDGYRIDPLANNLTEDKYEEKNDHKNQPANVLTSTITIDIENLPLSQKPKDIKDKTIGQSPENESSKSLMQFNRSLECRAHNSFGTSRRFIKLLPGSKHYSDPWDRAEDERLASSMVLKSMVFDKFSYKQCQNTKTILLCIILMLLLILICIIPLTLARKRYNKKVVKFNNPKNSSFNNSIRRSMRAQNHHRQPRPNRNETQHIDEISIDPMTNNIFQRPASIQNNQPTLRTQSSLVNLGRVTDFNSRSQAPSAITSESNHINYNNQDYNNAVQINQLRPVN